MEKYFKIMLEGTTLQIDLDDEAPIELLMKQYFRRKIRSGEYGYHRSGMNTSLVPQQGRWFLASIGVKI